MSPDRLAAAISELAQRAEPADVRVQLHALAGIVANLVPGWEQPPAGADALEAALAAGDEAAAIAAMRDLGARGRVLVRPVDWSAASRG
jgi:hypothetical protein